MRVRCPVVAWRPVSGRVTCQLWANHKGPCQFGPERTTLTDSTQVYPEHRNIKPETGQQQDYVVLAEEERAKGFVRPYRDTYVHLACGSETRMARTIAETYARQPDFYGGTFCCACRAHFPLDQFVWKGTQEQVGS